MDDIEKILEKASAGDVANASELLPLVYDELRHLAASRMAVERAGQTLQPTALVHEAWLKLSNEDGKIWNDRQHFFRAAAQAMRRILVDRARQKSTLKRGQAGTVLNVHDLDLTESTPDDRILLVDEMMRRLEVEDPDSARIVTLKFFGGLTNKEIAGVLGVTERTAERQWAYARSVLFQMIQEVTE